MICFSFVYGPIKMTRCKQQKLSAWAINQVEYKAELHRIGDREKVEEVISFVFQFFLTCVTIFAPDERLPSSATLPPSALKEEWYWDPMGDEEKPEDVKSLTRDQGEHHWLPKR